MNIHSHRSAPLSVVLFRKILRTRGRSVKDGTEHEANLGEREGRPRRRRPRHRQSYRVGFGSAAPSGWPGHCPTSRPLVIAQAMCRPWPQRICPPRPFWPTAYNPSIGSPARSSTSHRWLIAVPPSVVVK